MRKEQRTDGEAALVQVQILYQKTHSGIMQYLENWKIFQNASRRSSLNSGQSEVFHMTAAVGPGAEAL